MFTFIKSRFAPATPALSQRANVESLLADLNEILEAQPVKATLTIDPNTGRIEAGLPDQMADELLALPAPEVEKEAA